MKETPTKTICLSTGKSFHMHKKTEQISLINTLVLQIIKIDISFFPILFSKHLWIYLAKSVLTLKEICLSSEKAVSKQPKFVPLKGLTNSCSKFYFFSLQMYYCKAFLLHIHGVLRMPI